MNTGGGVYLLIIILINLLFFGLFLRLFFWKSYADKYFWKAKPVLSRDGIYRLAQKKFSGIPKFSIFIPARDESGVIENTLHHLFSLDYPPEKYEIIVVTDEKERIHSNEIKRQSIDWLLSNMNFDGKRLKPSPIVKHLLKGALSRYVLTNYMSIPEVRKADVVKLLNIANTVERFGVFSNFGLLKSDKVYLDLAWVVTGCYTNITGEGSYIPAKYRQTVNDIYDRIKNLYHSNKLRSFLEDSFSIVFPTTQDIVESVKLEVEGKQGFPMIKHVEVPFDFSGRYGGGLTGKWVASTKGRALNYALDSADPESAMFGFYDAESRPDKKVLLYIAYRCLKDGPEAHILQGPVFQVRNFFKLGPFCKVASLYQSVSHDWYLPILFKRLPFVGGTNLFISPSLLKKIRGYDHTCLTEDLEIGARAYLRQGVWPEYFPYPSTEQTPATIRAFFRQRLRWASGYLQVLEKIKKGAYPVERKKRLLKTFYIKGPVEWSLYQSAVFVPIVSWYLWTRGFINPGDLSLNIRAGFCIINLIYLSFTYYTFFRYRRYFDISFNRFGLIGVVLAMLNLLFLPIAAFFLPLPYSSALVLKILRRAPNTWIKTPRTIES